MRPRESASHTHQTPLQENTSVGMLLYIKKALRLKIIKTYYLQLLKEIKNTEKEINKQIQK